MLEEKLRALENQYAELEARLAAPETYADPARVAQLNREQRELEPVVTAYRAYERRKRDLADAEALLSDPDMKELAQEEYTEAKADVARLEEEIRVLLLPRDPNDGKNVIVEIRAGVGGEEAVCMPCTPRPGAGMWRSPVSVTPSWAGSRRSALPLTEKRLTAA